MNLLLGLAADPLDIVAVVVCVVLGLVLVISNWNSRRQIKRLEGKYKKAVAKEKEKTKSSEVIQQELENCIQKADENYYELFELHKKTLEWSENEDGKAKPIQLDVNVRDHLELVDKNLLEAHEMIAKFEALRTHVTGTQETALGKIKDVAEVVGIATDAAQKRDEELSQYREGYLQAVKSSFVDTVIEAISNIEDWEKNEEVSPAMGLKYTKKKLSSFLRLNLVERFEPPLGERLKDNPGCESVAPGIELPEGGHIEIEGKDGKKILLRKGGLIAEVKNQGFRLTGVGKAGDEDAQYRILRKAFVVVTEFRKEASEEVPIREESEVLIEESDAGEIQGEAELDVPSERTSGETAAEESVDQAATEDDSAEVTEENHTEDVSAGEGIQGTPEDTNEVGEE